MQDQTNFLIMTDILQVYQTAETLQMPEFSHQNLLVVMFEDDPSPGNDDRLSNLSAKM